MKYLLLIMSILLILSGCTFMADFLQMETVYASGPMLNKSISSMSFTGISVGNAMKVSITQGSEYNVEIRTNENIFPYFEIETIDDILVIDLERNNYIDLDIEVDIVMPEISIVNFSGACQGDISGFDKNTEADFRLSGASALSGEFFTEEIRIYLSGASIVTVEGSAK